MRSLAGSICLLVVAVVGCRVQSDDCGTHYRCEDRCPCGQRCVRGECVDPIDAGEDGGATDAGDSGDAPGDASSDPDASQTVCERADQAPDNDFCGDAIDLTDALATGPVTVYGDTSGYDDDLAPAIITDCTDYPEPGPDAIYRMDLEAGDELTAELRTDGGWNAGLYLLEECSPMADCFGEPDDAGGANETMTDLPIAASGTYYLVVDASIVDVGGCFTLEVERHHP